MVIRNEHRASGLLRAHLLARSFVIVVGCLAVSWGVVEFPVFWQESSLERVGDRIIAGAPFKPEIIASRAPGRRDRPAPHGRSRNFRE
jgi:hypothetical protein